MKGEEKEDWITPPPSPSPPLDSFLALFLRMLLFLHPLTPLWLQVYYSSFGFLSLPLRPTLAAHFPPRAPSLWSVQKLSRLVGLSSHRQLEAVLWATFAAFAHPPGVRISIPPLFPTTYIHTETEGMLVGSEWRVEGGVMALSFTSQCNYASFVVGRVGWGERVVCCFVLHWTKKLLYFFFLSMYNCTPCIFFFSKQFPLPLRLYSRHLSFHRNVEVVTLPVRSGISA